MYTDYKSQYIDNDNRGGGKLMKLAIIYHSKTGNTKMAGEWIADGMNEVEGVEAKAFSLDALDEDFIKEAKGIVVGSPSYLALMTPELHSFLLNSAKKLGFAGKLGGAFATEQYTQGGGTIVIQAILMMELVNGMVCYSSGGAFGHPYIHLGPVGVNNNKEQHNGMEHYKGYFTLYGRRFAEKAAELFG